MKKDWKALKDEESKTSQATSGVVTSATSKMSIQAAGYTDFI